MKLVRRAIGGSTLPRIAIVKSVNLTDLVRWGAGARGRPETTGETCPSFVLREEIPLNYDSRPMRSPLEAEVHINPR